MSWVVNTPLSWFQKFCVNVLKNGPVPNHVAIIMDGNRRFAKKKNVQKVEGHSKGFDKFTETLQWCRELGIKEVTVYAFSIENFKRSQEEVDALMRLAREKFNRLLEERDKLNREGVCIRVVGDLSLVPDDIRKLFAKAEIMTKDNNKAFLNIAFAYTSRNEITNAIKTVVEGLQNEKISPDDVNCDLLSQCMYTNRSKNPDLLIRTSGEVRFSDFLLWQVWNTDVCFTEVLWPEFSIWHLLAAVFHYQRCCSDLKKFKLPIQNEERSEKAETFLNDLKENRMSRLSVDVCT